MKSLLIIIPLFFLAVQVPAQSKWSYAIYGSAGASHIHYSKILRGSVADTKVPAFRAWQAGGYVQYHLNRHWSMRYGAAWQLASDQQNALLDYGPVGPDQPSSQSFRHQDLLLPAEIVFNRARSRRGFHIAGQLTPVLALQRKVEETTYYAFTDPPVATTTDITKSIGYRRADLYMGFSLGWEFPLGSRYRLLAAPFYMSNFAGNLLGLGEDQGWPEFTNPMARVFGVRVGVLAGGE